METLETIAVVHESSVDGGENECKYKSNLKKNRSPPSSSGVGERRRRVRFRETIEVFSDGEESHSVPLNDDFTSFPSLRSPLKRLLGGKRRAMQRSLCNPEDLYVVGELYSNVPIVVLKKGLGQTSVDLVAPLATMDDMDLHDEFEDDDDDEDEDDERWMDEIEEAVACYSSAESDSEEVDEVMDTLLREKCLSDEEDRGGNVSPCNSEDGGGEEEDDDEEEMRGEVTLERRVFVVDVVKKVTSEDDFFFDEANIEEIESSSSTDSVADSLDHQNGSISFDETRDIHGNPTMDAIPEEQVPAPPEGPRESASPFIDGSGIKVKINASNPEDPDRADLLATSGIPSPFPGPEARAEVEFKEVQSNVARSKSADFKDGLDGCSLDVRMRVNSMMDSGFASLEMADLESKLASSPTDGKPPARKVEDGKYLGDEEISCSLDSNISSSLVNSSPEEPKKACGFVSGEEAILNDADLPSRPEESASGTKCSIPTRIFLGSSCVHEVELLPILTWIFSRPE